MDYNYIIENKYIQLLLVLFYFISLSLIYKYINSMFVHQNPYVYNHPFNQWWKRKETSMSSWYQDHFFDSKRPDNLFPTYQNI